MPYGASDVRARDILARILLVSWPKSGKTVCAVTTSPGPRYVINTDGEGGLDPVMLFGCEDWEAEDIKSSADFPRALLYLKQNITKFKTVVFDNLSTYALIVEDEVRKELRDDPRVIYPEITRRVLRVVRELIALPLHVVITSQTKPDQQANSGAFDHLLSLSGNATISIPMLMQDWIWLEVHIDEATGRVDRRFFLSPQGTWKKAVRSLKDVAYMEANISEFLNMCRSVRQLPAGEQIQEQLEQLVQDVTSEGPVGPSAEVEEKMVQDAVAVLEAAKTEPEPTPEPQPVPGMYIPKKNRTQHAKP